MTSLAVSTSTARSNEALYAHLSNADRYIHETRDQAFFSLLKQSSAFDIVKMPNGSNIFRLVVKGTEPETFRANLRAKGVLLSLPRPGLGFVVTVNQTLNRTNAQTLAKVFLECL